MIDFRATGGGVRGVTAGIMQRSCETVGIGGSFLFWCACPKGYRWAREQKMKGERGGGVVVVGVGGSH